jgi:6-pyruvoyltetrahydropterin/6-carboxytetrahydropterin synthase
MAIKFKSTKSFKNLPCGHAQYFDMTPDGKPGACAAVHGYDREVIFTFAGEIDQYGWIFPFGDLKKVKEFLEFYFDHTTILAADDPRLDTIDLNQMDCGGLLGTLKVLPSGVSMEMSSMFIWERVNPFIYHRTGGRVYVERVECREHERNSAMLEVDEHLAIAQAEEYRSDYEMILKPYHEYEAPKQAVQRINSIGHIDYGR